MEVVAQLIKLAKTSGEKITPEELVKLATDRATALMAADKAQVAKEDGKFSG